MPVFSAFVSPDVSAYSDDVNGPDHSSISESQRVGNTKYNVLYKKTKTVALDDDDTHNLTFFNSTATEWVIYALRVKGYVRVTLGNNPTGGGSSSGVVLCYGTEKYPGILFLSTKNITSCQLRGETDGTEVEVFAAVSCADSDARLEANE